MHNLIKRLEKKGWGKKDISKAVKIIQKAKQDKTKEALFIGKRIYWVLLFVIITANFALSVALVPALVVLSGFLLYLVIITLGLGFGLMLELVIRSIEHFEKGHHLSLVILIPLIALINSFIMSNTANEINLMLNIKNAHAPLLIALVYAISLVLPYIIYRFVFRIEYYAAE